MSDEKPMYKELFNTAEDKAEAFDKIAEKYYECNFGSVSKSDLDILMFSIYIEQILKRSEDDISTYSDYTLAKQLGITQSKVSNLKVKKQLKYPYEPFEWKKSFARVCKNARLESDKIKINLRDKNLYYELKNQIEEWGSYIEGSLTPNLLIITPEEFFELTKMFMSDEELEEIKKNIKVKYNDNKQLCENLEKEPVIKALKKCLGKELVIDVVLESVKMVTPGIAGTGIEIIKNCFNAISGSLSKK